MASRKIKTIAVDEKFFNNYFEPKRLEFQKKLGLNNLSQVKFTMMISGLKFRKPKKTLEFKPKMRKKKNDFFNI